MYKIKYLLVFYAALAFPTMFFAGALEQSYALLDTEGIEQGRYAILTEFAQEHKLNLEYVSLADIIDKNLSETLGNKKGIFFIIGDQFLNGLGNHSFLSKKILAFMQAFCQQPDKLIAFFFPSFAMRASAENPPNVIHAPMFKPIFKTLSLKIPPTIHSDTKLKKKFDALKLPDKLSTNLFWHIINKFLTTPFEKRRTYHTTLNEHQETAMVFTPLNMQSFITQKTNYQLPTPLPSLDTHFAQAIKKLFPFGIYWHSPLQTDIFISFTTMLTADGPEENFHLFPTDETLKKDFRQAIKETLLELFILIDKNKTPKDSNLLKSSEQTENKKTQQTFARSNQEFIAKNDNMTSQIRKTAWMELTAFENTEKLKKQQKKLIQYIYQAGLDTLWISITPNIFYSPIARQKSKEPQCLESIKLFTHQLQQGSKTYNSPVPRILLGFEIADNLYTPNLPTPHAVDLYNNDYHDLPTPLNLTFWDQEIKQPLEQFLEQWQTHAHGIPISGIVLDLEMYCRKKTGLFLAPMGFDHQTFQKFAQQQALTTVPQSLQKKVTFLMRTSKGKEYFSFLEQEANLLGKHLKEFFLKKIPNCLITCYTPTLQTNWFYKGFWKGLSSQEHPLHLFSFNTDFYRHQPWLTEQEIYTHHSSVLLLSKINRIKDCSWIDAILKNHDGIWLNRFSRLIEPYDRKSWTHVEQTPLKHKKKIQVLKYLSNFSNK